MGKFLRSTSIDELPQLINVLKNDLSFVGPRPIVQEELERYGDESGLFLHIKPGLTGLWQVSGRNDIDYDSRVKLDIYYIENWSIGMDMAIILRTIPALLFRKNGY
jgi:lipopolysaccharide/colanic/teichoic acid biosynthesis glycosyltransferase